MVIVVAGYFINPAIERTETDHALKSLRENVRRNISEIKEAMK
jgi:Na+/melibiose symporter-like transporter